MKVWIMTSHDEQEELTVQAFTTKELALEAAATEYGEAADDDENDDADFASDLQESDTHCFVEYSPGVNWTIQEVEIKEK